MTDPKLTIVNTGRNYSNSSITVNTPKRRIIPILFAAFIIVAPSLLTLVQQQDDMYFGFEADSRKIRYSTEDHELATSEPDSASFAATRSHNVTNILEPSSVGDHQRTHIDNLDDVTLNWTPPLEDRDTLLNLQYDGSYTGTQGERAQFMYDDFSDGTINTDLWEVNDADNYIDEEHRLSVAGGLNNPDPEKCSIWTTYDFARADDVVFTWRFMPYARFSEVYMGVKDTSSSADESSYIHAIVNEWDISGFVRRFPVGLKKLCLAHDFFIFYN